MLAHRQDFGTYFHFIPQNVQVLPYTHWRNYKELVEKTSGEADLVMMGFTREHFGRFGTDVFTRLADLRDTLFVRVAGTISLTGGRAQ